MTDREDNQEVQPAELWPGRYIVRAHWPDGEMAVFQPELDWLEPDIISSLQKGRLHD